MLCRIVDAISMDHFFSFLSAPSESFLERLFLFLLELLWGVDEPDSGAEVEVSSFLFFLGAFFADFSGMLTADSDSESDSSEPFSPCSAAAISCRFFAIPFDNPSNLMCAFARSLASCSALSRSYLSFPA